jgi:hypothetical protein
MIRLHEALLLSMGAAGLMTGAGAVFHRVLGHSWEATARASVWPFGLGTLGMLVICAFAQWAGKPRVRRRLNRSTGVDDARSTAAGKDATGKSERGSGPSDAV